MLLVLMMLLGLITGIREGWTIFDSLYFAFVTAFTIGYGDLAPTYHLKKILAVVIGLIGFLFRGVLVAIAVESVQSSDPDPKIQPFLQLSGDDTICAKV
ncbi:MAG: potassium channel family protein [Deltaproteobacteria bacterium]|nr:potassium channel family protein [Deltaproteobacteria bacterium]